MATFSAELKEELIGHLNRSSCDKKAELAGMIFVGARRKGESLELRTENPEAAKKCFTSFCKALKIVPGTAVSSNRNFCDKKTYFLRVPEGEVSGIFKGYNILDEKACCRRAFLRGAYIFQGSISDPKKGYHFDIAAGSSENAKLLKKLIETFNVSAKVSTRRGKAVVYLKESEEISSMLAILEANVSMMNFENTRILREMKGSTNRRTNCETANIYRTVSASLRQIEDIEFLDEKIGLANIDPKLKEAALLRLEAPDASYAELGQMFNPPVGRSGANHRLRRISELAEELKKQN